MSRSPPHFSSLLSLSPPYINLTASLASSFLPPPPSHLPSLSMLDFDPLLPAYPPHIQYNDYPFRLQAMQADPVAYNSYSPHTAALGKVALKSPPLTPPPAFAFNPGPQSFTFDPFADEDSSTSSGASERERELEVQRLRRIEFLRRREWMRRVVAWVDGISHSTVSGFFPSPLPSVSAFHFMGVVDLRCQ